VKVLHEEIFLLQLAFKLDRSIPALGIFPILHSQQKIHHKQFFPLIYTNITQIVKTKGPTNA